MAFVAYKNGAIIASMRFDGTGTDKLNWFSKGKLSSNTVWNDLASKNNNYFRLEYFSVMLYNMFLSTHCSINGL